MGLEFSGLINTETFHGVCSGKVLQAEFCAVVVFHSWVNSYNYMRIYAQKPLKLCAQPPLSTDKISVYILHKRLRLWQRKFFFLSETE